MDPSELHQPVLSAEHLSPEHLSPEHLSAEHLSAEHLSAEHQDFLGVSLRGRALRFVLVDELRSRDTMTVAEMVGVLADCGFDLGGRASKVISDALRWELARGRVQRLGRGVYCYHRAPVSTARRIRIFAATCRAWLVAVTRTEPPTEAAQGERGRLSGCRAPGCLVM